MEASDPSVLDQAPPVFHRLRRLAEHYLRHERPDHTLQPTALVHEALMRIANRVRNQSDLETTSLISWTARAMRSVLVDHARRRAAAKRTPGDQPNKSVSDDIDAAVAQEILDVDRVLERLVAVEPQWRTLVELRYFGGCTEAETARLLGVSLRTLQRQWRLARAWLRAELSKERSDQ